MSTSFDANRGEKGEKEQAASLTSRIDTAINVGEKFVKLYYDHCDRVRHKLKKLYHTEGVLLWNGHHIVGPDNIQAFYDEMPSSRHIVQTIDSQPVSGAAVEDQSTLFVTTSGFVSFNTRRTSFQQTFLITVDKDNWKIVSDTFRNQ